jgi:hypothetical protein
LRSLVRILEVVPLALLVLSANASPEAGQAAADTWAPLPFLLGTWEGTSSGQPGNGQVRREYRLVRDQFIEVRNTSTYPPQEKNPKGEAGVRGPVDSPRFPI